MRPWGIKRLFSFPSRSRAEVRYDIADEFAFHLEMRADELRRDGLSDAEARAAAAREFGEHERPAADLAQVGDRLEGRRRVGQSLSELWRDAGIGLRLLQRSPGFAAVAILTLAIGIGANTAIYSVLDAVLLRPLPYPEADRLVLVNETLDTGSPNNASGGAFLDWHANETRFEALALMGQVRFNLRRTGAAPERLSGMEVSHEFLRVLGVPPLLGRGFIPEDDRPGGHNAVVILTEELWRSRFGADPAIVGRTIVLDEIARTVVGVVPAGTWMFKDDVFFVPAVLEPGTQRAQRQPHWAVVIGRLAPGASVLEADTELKSVKQRLNAEYPEFKKDWGVVVRPVTEVLGGVTRTPLLILLGAVSLVLLIACANVANLVLARSLHRQQELAVRAAIGASGGRLVRQVLTENLVLALLGGAAGVLVAYAGVHVLRDLAAKAMPITFTPALDLRVLMFSLAVTVATGPLFGLLPALRARRPDLNATLTNGGRGATASGHQRTQMALIAAEVALTVVLLASAGLLLRSLARAASTDPGFQPAGVLAFDLSLPDSSYASADARLAFVTELLARVRALPGVQQAGSGMAIPFAGGGYGEFFNRPDGREEDAVIGRLDFVSPGYLEALGTRLLVGRRLADADNRADGPRVVVISESTARRFFPKGGAIGQPLRIAGDRWTVVGVIGDVVDRRLDAVRGAFGYVPHAFNTSQLSVAVRTTLPPMSVVETIRREMARLDQGVALANPRGLERAMADSMLQRKVVLGLIGTFALAALVLASIGLYGVMSYSVETRRREFGIRIAFGAARGDLIGQVLGRGLRMIAVGLLFGLAGALGAAQLLASELYQVGQRDPMVIAGTSATVIAVALLACFVPAWRAAKVEPVVALRTE
jgi:predicted permease